MQIFEYKEAMQELVKVLKALCDEVRLRILKVLQEGNELCVCEIMRVLDISQTRASRNLGILRDAGFVACRREGAWKYYSINRRKINEYHIELMKLLSNWLNEDETIQNDREKLKKILKSGVRHKHVKDIEQQATAKGPFEEGRTKELKEVNNGRENQK